MFFLNVILSIVRSFNEREKAAKWYPIKAVSSSGNFKFSTDAFMSDWNLTKLLLMNVMKSSAKRSETI